MLPLTFKHFFENCFVDIWNLYFLAHLCYPPFLLETPEDCREQHY